MVVSIESPRLLAMYETMLLIRRFEERMRELFMQNKLPGFLHLSLGQEAIAAGVCANLDRSDVVVTTHRGHGHTLAKGADLNAMVAELYGKQSGSCRGVGGSMHLTDPDVGVLCADAIVGASIALATGAGFSFKVRGTSQAAVAFFGDGAANTGSFHESLNVAALWNLPVIFVCENNLYAEMTHRSFHTKVEDIASRAVGYGMPGVIVDGNDVTAVYEAAREAVNRARAGEGPTLLECKTYRHGGHFEGDQQKYKPAEEVARWLARDPIKLIEEKLAAQGLMSPADSQAISDRIVAGINEAIALAEADTYADASVLTDLMYANPIPAGGR